MQNNIFKLNRRYLTATLLALISTGLQAHQASKPRLVISIVINQLTSECLEEYSEALEDGGLKQLLASGKVYSSATMPFPPTDAASAITTIYTGTTPYYNGIASASWLDRNSLKVVSCVDDSKYRGAGSYEGGSAANVMSSMIGDELKAKTSNLGLVYSIAINREAAILSASHSANGALWVDNKTGRWNTSTYYLGGLPNWLDSFEKQSVYTTEAEDNNRVANAAISCIANASLGKDDNSDILALTFEVADDLNTYKQLNNDLGRLLKTAKDAVGESNLLVVATGTGVAPRQKVDYELLRIPHGTFSIDRTAKLLDLYLNAVYGQGKYVDGSVNNHIYLNSKLSEQKKIDMDELLARSQVFLLETSGVSNVYSSRQLMTASSDMLAPIRNSFNSNTCGDLIIETLPGWNLVNENTRQDITTQNASAQFHIIVWGAGTKAERISTPVSAVSIAPTISKAIKIRAPNACTAAPLR